MAPRYATCDSCGRAIVFEYGKFDADAYDNGVLNRHFCEHKNLLPPPMNEREWAAFIETEDARTLLGLHPLRATRPGPPPVSEPPPKAGPRPPNRKGGVVRGGVD